MPSLSKVVLWVFSLGLLMLLTAFVAGGDRDVWLGAFMGVLWITVFYLLINSIEEA